MSTPDDPREGRAPAPGPPQDPVRSRRDGAVMELTIDRPEALNALDASVIEALIEAVETFLADDAARVLVLTGAGPKAFVAGADIASMATLTPEQAEAFSRRGQHLGRLLAGGPKVTIAAVHGFALGGGCELALSCDLIVAGPKARFGLPEVKLGVIPGFGGTQRLARRVGAQRALLLALSGRMIGADEARRIGLAAHVCGDGEEARDAALAVASEIASHGWLAVRAARELIDRGAALPIDEGLDAEARAFGALFATQDQREGMRAFLEKRPARFSGR